MMFLTLHYPSFINPRCSRFDDTPRSQHDQGHNHGHNHIGFIQPVIALVAGLWRKLRPKEPSKLDAISWQRGRALRSGQGQVFQPICQRPCRHCWLADARTGGHTWWERVPSASNPADELTRGHEGPPSEAVLPCGVAAAPAPCVSPRRVEELVRRATGLRVTEDCDAALGVESMGARGPSGGGAGKVRKSAACLTRNKTQPARAALASRADAQRAHTYKYIYIYIYMH